jgi:hypothetical protein
VVRELHEDASVIEPHRLPIGSAPGAGERDRMPAITNGSIGMFDDAAYTMAAVTATIALYRALVRKGLMPRKEAMQILLDETIAHAMQTEALMQQPGVSNITIEINRQCEEILKFMAEHL